MSPLSIDTDYYQGDLIKIYVGETAPGRFLDAISNQQVPRIPQYMPPINQDLMKVEWHVAQGKNVMINGKLERNKLTDFIELLHSYGAWSVCGFDLDNELHLINAPVFRIENGLG